MKRLFFIAIVLLLPAVCACTPSREFSNLDAEFGLATRKALDSQVAHPEATDDMRVPEGIEGISAEELMNTYNSTFSKPPEPIEVFSMGFTGSNK